MKLDRLLQMVIMLLNRRRVKAQEIAAHFGVSVRTVYRDMETLSLAGIPVITYPGLNGGIGIAEGFRMDRTVLSEEELASVMVALKSVSSSLQDAHAEAVQEKIRSVVTGHQAERFRERTDSLRVDFGPWGHSAALKDNLKLLKEAADGRQLVRFMYCNAKGENERRTVEPYTVVLKNNRWYLYAFCIARNDFRFFKLTRMKEAEALGESFVKRQVNLDELPWEKAWVGTVSLLLRFPKELRPLVEDWFGIESVEEEQPLMEGSVAAGVKGSAEANDGKAGGKGSAEANEGEAGGKTEAGSRTGRQSLPHRDTGGGTLLVRTSLPEDDGMYGYLLGFGDKMEVIEPERVRQRIRSMAERVAALYSELGAKT